MDVGKYPAGAPQMAVGLVTLFQSYFVPEISWVFLIALAAAYVSQLNGSAGATGWPAA
jgi:hypothetical protein